MNKLNKIIVAALISISLPSFANDCPTLSGELTIGSSEGSNFSSITEATEALKCGGVDGPVTFYIENGIYEERVALSRINGSSVFNNIRFASQSGNNADVVINFSKGDATMVFLGSSHIAFENLTIDHKDATYGNCVRVEGETNDLLFRNVVFNGVDMLRTGAANAPVYCTSAGSKNGIVFEECEINNGSIGICKGGESKSNRNTKTSITGTSFFNQNESGIALVNEDAPVITNNIINTLSANNSFKAIQLDNVSNLMVISKNTINTLNSATGLLIHDCMAQSSSPAQIIDNSFGIGGTSHAYGIRVTGATDNQVIDYNTIKLMVNQANASTQAYYLNTTSGNNIGLMNCTYYDLNKGTYMVYTDSYKSISESKTSSSFSASAEGMSLEKGTVIK